MSFHPFLLVSPLLKDLLCPYTLAVFSPSCNLEASDSRPKVSDGSSESSVKSVVPDGVKHESSLQLGSPVHSFSESLGDWMPIQDDGHLQANEYKIPNHAASSSLHVHEECWKEGPNCNETFNFCVGDFDPMVVTGDASNSDYLNQGAEFQCTGFQGNLLSERMVSVCLEN